MTTAPIQDNELEQHYCLESVDKVHHDAETTAFKRAARLHQAVWRESRHLDMGSQPIRPKLGYPSRQLGSRLACSREQEWSNFLGDPVVRAVADRLANPERLQTLKEDRLRYDLLSSMPMCFNLFGWLHGDPEAATRAVRAWWPTAPGPVCRVRFEWSPGRQLTGEYLENRSAFDAAFELALDGGNRGVVGIETKYHEDCRREKAPGERRRRRYEEITNKSGVFKAGALDVILGTELQQIWLDHLLALSMLQHPTCKWTWVKFILVHPARNPSFRLAAEHYCALLTDSSTFQVRTIESLIEAKALPAAAATAFADRYLW